MRTPKVILSVIAVAAAAFVAYAWHVDDRGAVDGARRSGPLKLAGSAVEQGRYLAAAADCVACHTVPGQADYAGGVAFRLPFGTIYSSNLTPDAETGIGGWSDEDFLRAVRGGVGRGGRHLYPAHPYATYAGMARDDVIAIKAYLASLPAVRNRVPESNLSFPFSQRGLMRFWNALYLDGQRFEPDASHDEAWNQGAYLANALGHCGECHTPRNVAYALRSGKHALTGATTRGWKAYDITARPSGVGSWTAAALEEYLATGHAEGHGSASGPMKEVVAYSTSVLSTSDRRSLVAYLLAGRPAGDSTPPSVPVGSAAADGGVGATLYAGTCAGCHPLGGGIASGSYASLAGASSVRDPAGTNVLRLLAEGSPHGVAGDVTMPGFDRAYTDTERAAIANYVLAHWGGLTPALTPNDALRAREAF